MKINILFVSACQCVSLHKIAWTNISCCVYSKIIHAASLEAHKVDNPSSVPGISKLVIFTCCGRLTWVFNFSSDWLLGSVIWLSHRSSYQRGCRSVTSFSGEKNRRFNDTQTMYTQEQLNLSCWITKCIYYTKKHSKIIYLASAASFSMPWSGSRLCPWATWRPWGSQPGRPALQQTLPGTGGPHTEPLQHTMFILTSTN